MGNSISGDKDIQWDIVIGAESKGVNFGLKDIYRYRDLMVMFVKRDIVTVYKQTILGPLWFVVQPLLTTFMYLLVFTNIAGIKTGAVPPILFYMLGITLWNYFSETLNITSKTFIDNANVFGKVYFPRVILPVSKAVSGFVKFLIQFALFIIIWLYYALIEKSITPNVYVLLAPLFLFVIIVMGFSFGILISSLTTKYRDLMFLVSFGVQLVMYATPVIIPLSGVQGKKRFIFLLNPLTSLFEGFKAGFLGNGILEWKWIGYSVVFTVVLLFIGIASFNKIEKKFIDTV